MTDTPPLIAALHRYPVKGLSPEPLKDVVLESDGGFPFDRAYAIENGPSGFDPTAPRHFPKTAFLMLMRNESLAALSTRFDDETGVLTIRRNGATVAEGNLGTEAGRTSIEAFFDAFSATDLRGPAKVLTAPGHSFPDAGVKCVSLINLASVRDLENTMGAPVNPLRFRGNLHVEGLAPWTEFDLVGARLRIGGVTFAVSERINRCAATNVDPDTAIRDLAIPRTLLDTYGHSDCGVYLRVVEGGTVAVADAMLVA